MAILLVFVELGFLCRPAGWPLLYDKMRFDLLLASNEYEYQAQRAFPLTELAGASSPDVEEAAPIISASPNGRVAKGACRRTFL